MIQPKRIIPNPKCINLILAQIFMIIEEQDNGTTDYMMLHYLLKDGDKAYFSEEYLSVGMKKDGQKKPDITAIVENSTNRKIKWFIYDMKDTVIKAKTAAKLCAQWHQGIAHITREYLENKSGYQIEDSVGVITRYWDKEKLEEEIQRYKARLNSKNNLLTARKSWAKVGEYREKIQAVKNIIDEVYVDYDETSGGVKQYKIHYVNFIKKDDLRYTASMDIQL